MDVGAAMVAEDNALLVDSTGELNNGARSARPLEARFACFLRKEDGVPMPMPRDGVFPVLTREGAPEILSGVWAEILRDGVEEFSFSILERKEGGVREDGWKSFRCFLASAHCARTSGGKSAL